MAEFGLVLNIESDEIQNTANADGVQITMTKNDGAGGHANEVHITAQTVTDAERNASGLNQSSLMMNLLLERFTMEKSLGLKILVHLLLLKASVVLKVDAQ